MPIEVGKKPPAFTLATYDGSKVKLSDHLGKYVVVYFYPKDMTPGCTIQATEFTGLKKEYDAANAVVLGISKDSVETHCKFRDKHDLTIALLSDPKGTVMEKYGAWGEKNMYGKKTVGVIRSTVLVGPDGKVVKHWKRATSKGHAAKVLEVIQGHAAK